MTPIDCSLFNREREEAVGENEAICTMGCVRRVLYMRTGTCLNRCKDILELCIRVHFHCFFFSMLNSHGRVFASNCLHEFASNHLFPLTLVCLYSISLHVGHTIYNMTDLAPFCIYIYIYIWHMSCYCFHFFLLEAARPLPSLKRRKIFPKGVNSLMIA